MSREATAPSAHAGGDAAANGGYLGTLSNLLTSLAADATASATRAEDRVLDAVEAGLEGVESGAKHLRSSLETRARAMASLTRRMDSSGGDASSQMRSAAAYVASLERAIDDYDVHNAHHVSRAQRVAHAAAALSTTLRGHAEAWRETDAALATLPDTVSKVWAVDRDIKTTCDLMSETEQLLLEAEIAVEVDALYWRDAETRVSRRAAKSAHRDEVEKLAQFRLAMETQARDTHVTMRSAEEIALEETLRRELRVIRKQTRKNAKALAAKEGEEAVGEKNKGKSFLPAPGKEDHYGMGVGDSSDDEEWRPATTSRDEKNKTQNNEKDDDDVPPRKRGTLQEAAGDVDVCSAVQRRGNELDDFLKDEDEEAEEMEMLRNEKRRAGPYTVYGLRKQADDSRAAIAAQREADANASAVAWLGSKSREAAEAIGLARKEALGLEDDDLFFVNLKPPPPSGGAGDDVLDERETGASYGGKDDGKNKNGPSQNEHGVGSGSYNYERLQATTFQSAAVAKEALDSASHTAAAAAAQAARSAERASQSAHAVFAGFGSSLLSFGSAARVHAAASLELAQGRAKEGALWMNNSIGAAGDQWQAHLTGGGGGGASFVSGGPASAPAKTEPTPVPTERAKKSDSSPETGPDDTPVSLAGEKAYGTHKHTQHKPTPEPSVNAAPVNATPVHAAPDPEPSRAKNKNVTPAAQRSDRDEGFDEVMTKAGTFGYWKDRERETGACRAEPLSPFPSPKPSPNKARRAQSEETAERGE